MTKLRIDSFNNRFINTAHDKLFLNRNTNFNEKKEFIRTITQLQSQPLSEIHREQVWDLIKESKKYWSKESWKEVFRDLQPHQLQEVIQHSITKAAEDPKYTLDPRDLEIFDLEQTRNILPFSEEEMDQLIHIQANHTKNAIDNNIKKHAKKNLKEAIPVVLKQINTIFDRFIGALGVYEIFGRSNDENSKYMFDSGSNSQYAKAILETYLKFILLPQTLFIAVSAVVTSPIVAVGITILILSAAIAFIYAYIKYLRPVPDSVRGMQNLTLDLLKREEQPLVGRDDVLQKVRNAFESKKGVILIGEPGAGKSSVVKMIASRAYEGEMGSKLKKGYLFTCNASEIDGKFEHVDLGSVRSRFEGYEDNTVFFFDEIHTIFDKTVEQKRDTASTMLTFCDQYRNVIVATTKEQYEKMIKGANPAFLRRFAEPVELRTLSDHEIEIALYQHIEKAAPELIVDNEAIAYIVENANTFMPNTSKVDAATAFVSACLNAAISNGTPELDQKITLLKSQIHHEEQKYIHAPAEQLMSKRVLESTSKDQFDQQLASATEEKKKVLKQISTMKKVQEISWKWRQELYELSQKIQSSKNPQPLKARWMRLSLMQREMERNVLSMRNRLGLPAFLNKEVADKILREKLSRS